MIAYQRRCEWCREPIRNEADDEADPLPPGTEVWDEVVCEKVQVCPACAQDHEAEVNKLMRLEDER